jgi:4-amino-4-deoxy-L-arabinose transferase-like glycosyltransferase
MKSPSAGPGEESAESSSSTALPRWIRVSPVAIIAIAAVLLTALSFRALSASELRYAEAGREMLETGDWVVPRLGYVPYFEKPILFYWLEAAAQALLGDHPVVARAPSILAAVAMVATTYALGRDLRGRTTGLVAAALLLAAPAFQVMGTAATTDSVFAALLVLAWYSFWRHDQRPDSRWAWVFWAALGLAVMTKGPLGPALVATSVVAYLASCGRFRELWLLRPLRGVAVVAAINAPWTLLAWARDPRFLEFFYVRENLRAFVDSEVNHGKPLWYYPGVLLLGFLPFTGAIAVGLWTSARDAGSEGIRRFRGRGTAEARSPSPALYTGAMLWPPLVLLCIAQSKLATYLLPLLPAVAIAASGYVVTAHARLTRTMRWSAPLIVGVLAAVVASVPFVPNSDPDVASALSGHGTTLAVAVTILLAASVAGTVMVVRRRLAAGWVVAAGGMTAALFAALPVSDAMTERTDARALVAMLQRLRDPGSRVVVAGACAQDYTVVHGLRERVAIWGRARELGMGHFAEVTKPDVPIPNDPYVVSGANLTTNVWLIDDGRLAELWRGPEPVWLIGRPMDVTALRRAKLEVFQVATNSERVLVSNRALPTPP